MSGVPEDAVEAARASLAMTDAIWADPAKSFNGSGEEFEQMRIAAALEDALSAALDQANSRAEEAERAWKLADGRARRWEEALEEIKQAAIQYGVNDEVGAAIAHAEVVARSILPEPSSPIPATKDRLNPTNVDLFPKPSGSEAEGE